MVNWVDRASRVNRKWVDWCWVNWNCVHRGWMNWCGVSWLVGSGWMGDTIVLDISNITTIAIDISSVVHNLNAAIRQGHLVLSGYNTGVRSLMLVKAGARVVVMDTVLKSVGLGGLGIAMGGCVDWVHWMHYRERMNGGWRMNWQVGSIG